LGFGLIEAHFESIVLVAKMKSWKVIPLIKKIVVRFFGF
jgi:hypothetical protein